MIAIYDSIIGCTLFGVFLDTKNKRPLWAIVGATFNTIVRVGTVWAVIKFFSTYPPM